MKFVKGIDRNIHLTLMYVWVALIIPTVIFWSESILWIGFMSIYAIITAHWAAYESSKLKKENKDVS